MKLCTVLQGVVILKKGWGTSRPYAPAKSFGPVRHGPAGTILLGALFVGSSTINMWMRSVEACSVVYQCTKKFALCTLTLSVEFLSSKSNPEYVVSPECLQRLVPRLINTRIDKQSKKLYQYK